MNGSNNAAGSQDSAMTLDLGQPLTAVEEGLLLGDDGCPWSNAGRCLLCRLRCDTTASCEQEKRVLEILERRREKPLTIGLPQRLVICMDCCNTVLNGHQCWWRDLCWRNLGSRSGVGDGATERL